MAENEKLTNRQLLAIAQIISSPTLEEAHKKARISKSTLYIWLKEKAFKAELKCQRDEVIRESLGSLKSAVTKAVQELVNLMDTTRPDLRRLVCRDILDYAFKTIELEDIEERFERLENASRGGRK